MLLVGLVLIIQPKMLLLNFYLGLLAQIKKIRRLSRPLARPYGVLNAFAQRADDDLGGIRSYLYRIDNWLNMDNHGKRLQSILDSLRQQWGYNYGTGNTVVASFQLPRRVAPSGIQSPELQRFPRRRRCRGLLGCPPFGPHP